MFATYLLQEGAHEGGLGWLVWVVLLVFLVMVFLGWLVSSKGWLKKEAEPVQHHDDHSADHAVEATQPISAPVVAASVVADDLTVLEGIGPKVAKLLAGIGITSFAALAAADLAKLREALDGAGYKYMEPAGWVEQAALAAKGDAEGLKKLQDSLKGGRKIL
jgi:predicted flap endonuclease-1-like 5' DNA nuclease